MSSITITVPMSPPSEMLPNNRHRRGGLRPGIAAAQEFRLAAKYAAMNACNGTPLTGPVHLIIHAAYGYNRVTPDLDGTVSATKPAIDGLADAGVIVDDDQVQMITATHEKIHVRRRGERPQGYTRLTVMPMNSEATA